MARVLVGGRSALSGCGRKAPVAIYRRPLRVAALLDSMQPKIRPRSNHFGNLRHRYTAQFFFAFSRQEKKNCISQILPFAIVHAGSLTARWCSSLPILSNRDRQGSRRLEDIAAAGAAPRSIRWMRGAWRPTPGIISTLEIGRLDGWTSPVATSKGGKPQT